MNNYKGGTWTNNILINSTQKKRWCNKLPPSLTWHLYFTQFTNSLRQYDIIVIAWRRSGCCDAGIWSGCLPDASLWRYSCHIQLGGGLRQRGDYISNPAWAAPGRTPLCYGAEPAAFMAHSRIENRNSMGWFNFLSLSMFLCWQPE